MRTATGSDPVRRKRLLNRADHPRRDHRPGDVWPANHAAVGDLEYLLPGHRNAELDQPVDHCPGPVYPACPDGLALSREFGVVGIEEVGKQMHAVAVTPAG